MSEPNTTEARRLTWVPLAILGVMLLFKVLYLFFWAHRLPYYRHPMGDSAIYLDWARQIAGGDFWGRGLAFRVFYRAPLYSYTLALSLRLFGDSLLPVYIVQLLMGTFNILLTYLIARRLFSSRAGLAAMVLGALYAPLTFEETKLVPVTLVIAFVLLIVWLLTGVQDSGFGIRNSGDGSRTQDSESRSPGWRYFLAGLLAGLSVITWGGTLLLMPFMVIGLFVSVRNARNSKFRIHHSALGGVLLLVLGWVLAVAPVTLHNVLIGHDFVLIDSNGGLTFYQGNNPAAVGSYAPTPEIYERKFDNRYLSSIADQQTFDIAYASAELRPVRPGEPSELVKPSAASGFWMRRALSFVIRQPGRFLWLASHKLQLALSDIELPEDYNLDIEFQEVPILRLLFLPFAVIFALGIMGIIFVTRRRDPASLPAPRVWPLSVVVIALALTLLIFFVHLRYRLPTILPLAIFAGGATDLLVRRWQARQPIWPELGTAAGLALVSAVLCTVPLVAGLGFVTVEGYRNLGESWHLRLNNPARAEEAYDKALAILTAHKDFAGTTAPASARSELLILRGNALLDEQRLDSAALQYESALSAATGVDTSPRPGADRQLTPGLPRTYLRSWALYQLAFTYYRAAHVATPSSGPRARRLLDAARTTLGKLLAADSMSVQPALLLGGVYSLRGDADSALSAYYGVIGLDSNSAPAWLSIGDLLLARGDTAPALDAFSRANRLDTLNPLPATRLGTTYESQGNYEAARAVLTNALKRVESNPRLLPAMLRGPSASAYFRVKYLLGTAYLHQRDWDRAAEQARAILNLAPDNQPALQLLDGAQRQTVPPEEKSEVRIMN